jgi:TrmH family RNA methyltransferase
MQSAPRQHLTSTANPRVKAAVALRDRRERDRTGLTVVDGAREVRRSIEGGAIVVEAFVCEPLLAGEDARVILDRLATAAATVHLVSEPVFDRVSFGERAEGIVAVVRTPSRDLADLVLPSDPLVVVIEGIEKPGNLGAVLRSADGAGADAVVAADARTDLFNPNVIRASLGTAFSVPIASASTPQTLSWLRANGLRIVAARVDADRLYTDVDLQGAVAIALGAEAEGLTGDWSGDQIEAVRLPMAGLADSLNISATAAVLLYEARRQRGASSRTM